MIQRKLLNRRDICFFAGLVLLALLAYAWRGTVISYGYQFAQVSISGQIVWRSPLSTADEIMFEPDEVNVRFLLRDGAATFVCSDCPDQICVRSGFLSLPGQMAVCVPNRTSLLIISEQSARSDNADTFAY